MGNRQIDLVCRSWNQIAYHVNGEERQRTLTLSTPEDASKVWTMLSTAHVAPVASERPEALQQARERLNDAVRDLVGVVRGRGSERDEDHMWVRVKNQTDSLLLVQRQSLENTEKRPDADR